MESLLNSLHSVSPEYLASNFENSKIAQEESCQSLLQNEQSVLTKVLSDAKDDNLSENQKEFLPQLTRLILEKRIEVDEFMRCSTNHTHVHLVLSFFRMALKNSAVIDECIARINQKFVIKLVRLGETYSELYLDSAFHSQKMFDKLLVELLLILSRIVSTPKLRNHSLILKTPKASPEHGQGDFTMGDDTVSSVIYICTSMLPSGKPNLTSCALQLLSNLLMVDDNVAICEKMIKGGVVSEVLDLLSMHESLTGATSSFGETVENSCGKLLLALTECDSTRERMSREVILRDGIVTILNRLSDCNEYAVWCCCWTLAKLALLSSSPEVSSVLINNCALPFLLSFVSQSPSQMHCPNDETGLQMALDKPVPETEEIESVKLATSSRAAICQVFARICFIESNCRLFVDSNGIYIMGRIVFGCHISTNEEMNEETIKLIASAVMVLRLIFSREFNRKVIWGFFPGPFLDEFVKCGNYSLIFSQYLTLARKLFLFMKESNKEIEPLQQKLEELDLTNRKEFKRIGQYKVLDALGDGSFGSVFKVIREGHESVHALKKISFGGTSAQQSAGKRKALSNTVTNEVNILKEKLNHPNIVKYLKTFHEEGNLYVVMEYVDGVSLYQHLNYIHESKSGPIKEDWIWNFAIQFIQGLRYLHVDRNLIHRDLSPNNILITFDDVVKITDFGFTRQGNESGVCTSVVGTVVYWCPEITQQKPYDAKADIWAYGCILYQTCTLKPPFEAENILLLAKKIVERKFQLISPELLYSKLLTDIIYSCITVDPEARPDSVGVIRMMGEKLLQQIDVQSEKLKQYRRKMSQMTSKYEESQRFKHSSNSFQFTSPSPTRTSTPPPEIPKKSGSSTSLNSDLAVSPLAASGSFVVPRLAYSAGSKRSFPNGSTLTVPLSKLREIHRVGDPLVESMEILRKIDSVCSSRQSPDNWAEKSLVLVMKRRLYENGDSTWMKSEVRKLISRSNDFIDFTSPGIGPLYSDICSSTPHFEKSYDQLIALCLRNLNASFSSQPLSSDANDADFTGITVDTAITYGEFMKILDHLISRS